MFGRAALLGLCVIAALAPDAALHDADVPASGAPVAAAAGPIVPVPAAPAPRSAALGFPVRLLIPTIGVDANIEARGLDAGRNMLTPRDFHDVAWYNLGPRPGQPGNALINGHVDWWTGSAVFGRLSRIRAGDLVIVVRADGSRLTFKVVGRQTVAANARVASLFTPRRLATLTLITCSGAWDPQILSATQRLLVSAVLV
jgi:sortase (surface protein transpeptidase)